MITVTSIHADGLAVTGADPVPWWVWAIAGGLVLLGIVFLLLRRRSGDDDALAAPIIATVDPSSGQGVGMTTPIPVDVSDDEARERVFKPSSPTPEATDADDSSPEQPPASEASDGSEGIDDPDTKQ